MPAGERCKFFSPTDRCADSLMFVSRDSDTVSAATDQDPQIELPVFNCDRYRVREIGIVCRIFRVGTKIFQFMPICKKLFKQLLVLKSSMITSDG